MVTVYGVYPLLLCLVSHRTDLPKFLNVSLSAGRAWSSIFNKKNQTGLQPSAWRQLLVPMTSCLLRGLYNTPALSQKPSTSLKILFIWLLSCCSEGGNVFLPSQEHEGLSSPKASHPHHEDVEQPLHYPRISEERPQPSAEQSNLDYKSLWLLKHSQKRHLWLRV